MTLQVHVVGIYTLMKFGAKLLQAKITNGCSQNKEKKMFNEIMKMKDWKDICCDGISSKIMFASNVLDEIDGNREKTNGMLIRQRCEFPDEVWSNFNKMVVNQISDLIEDGQQISDTLATRCAVAKMMLQDAIDMLDQQVDYYINSGKVLKDFRAFRK